MAVCWSLDKGRCTPAPKSLKVILQAELDNPLRRIVPMIARARDFAGLGVVPRVDIWIIELQVIEEVEEFCAKLQIVSFREMELRTARG